MSINVDVKHLQTMFLTKVFFASLQLFISDCTSRRWWWGTWVFICYASGRRRYLLLSAQTTQKPCAGWWVGQPLSHFVLPGMGLSIHLHSEQCQPVVFESEWVLSRNSIKLRSGLRVRLVSISGILRVVKVKQVEVGELNPII